jgi:hypothetical protein
MSRFVFVFVFVFVLFCVVLCCVSIPLHLYVAIFLSFHFSTIFAFSPFRHFCLVTVSATQNPEFISPINPIISGF